MKTIGIGAFLTLVTSLLTGGLAAIAQSGSASSEGNWTVSSDVVIVDQTGRVTGIVVIEAGATLHMKGSLLLIGDHLVVEDGGTLLLEPHSGQPSQLFPADQASGLWAGISGAIESRGCRRSLFEASTAMALARFSNPLGA